VAQIHQRLRAARCLLTSSGGACDGRAETANVDATFLATSVLYNDYDGSIDPKVIAAAIQSKYPDARLALVNLHIDENAHEPAVYADAYSRAVALLEATMVRSRRTAHVLLARAAGARQPPSVLVALPVASRSPPAPLLPAPAPAARRCAAWG
jgi:hypothetical protein